jgi:hypothetical protein
LVVDAAGAGLSELLDSLVLDDSDAGFDSDFDSDFDSLDEDEPLLSPFDSPPFESPPPDFLA